MNNNNNNNKTRLQKIIADSGFCSRRKAEAYIQSGLVNVNGRIAKLGDKADDKKDIITVRKSEGSPSEKIAARTASDDLRYIKMYKPRGVLCSMSDPHAGTKALITDLLSDIPERVYPVGRLDANSVGLILLTNDGDFANKITHPSSGIKKTYRVTIAGKVTEEQAARLSSGANIRDEDKKEKNGATSHKTSPCSVEIVTEEKNRTVLLMTISEGKNRQIRRMCEAIGLTVSRLKRISIGKIKLSMLKPGEFADLNETELRSFNIRNGSNKKPSTR
jgi:23S rRNA pseudouridine2605 synthase